MKVLIYSSQPFEKDLLEKANNGRLRLEFTTDALSPATAIQAVGCKAVSLFSSDEASLIVLEKLYDLGVRYITLRSAGYNNIQVKSAKRLGFTVANVPGYAPHAIAEHALAILLALVRKIREADRQLRRGDLRLDHLRGKMIHGRTVGIIGTGRIGSAMAHLFHGFGCKVLAHDKLPDKKLESDGLVQYTSLDKLLKSAEILSLHVPLTYETHHLIDREKLELIRPGAILVNTARGGLVATKAVLEALNDDLLGGYATDVYEKERHLFFRDWSEKGIQDELFRELIDHPRVLLTPHQAFMTDIALENIASTTIDNLLAWEEERTCPNELGYESVNS